MALTNRNTKRSHAAIASVGTSADELCRLPSVRSDGDEMTGPVLKQVPQNCADNLALSASCMHKHVRQNLLDFGHAQIIL